MINLNACFGITLLLVLSSCSSTPKSSQEKVSQEEAKAFLKKYCSTFNAKKELEQELVGETVVRSSTKEFKGQYPASLHFSKDKSFSLEVTNLLGGTVVLLKGDASSVEIHSPGRPQYNRKNIRQYMGLTIPMFAQLLHGDLPCPDSSSVQVDGNMIVVKDAGLEWRIERSDPASGSVPVRTRIFDQDKVIVEMLIESWNTSDFYAEKVRVRTSEGDLKWTWRSRALK